MECTSVSDIPGEKTTVQIIARPYISGNASFISLVNHVGLVINDRYVFDWDTKGVHEYTKREFSGFHEAPMAFEFISPEDNITVLHQYEVHQSEQHVIKIMREVYDIWKFKQYWIMNDRLPVECQKSSEHNDPFGQYHHPSSGKEQKEDKQYEHLHKHYDHHIPSVDLNLSLLGDDPSSNMMECELYKNLPGTNCFGFLTYALYRLGLRLPEELKKYNSNGSTGWTQAMSCMKAKGQSKQLFDKLLQNLIQKDDTFRNQSIPVFFYHRNPKESKNQYCIAGYIQFYSEQFIQIGRLMDRLARVKSPSDKEQLKKEYSTLIKEIRDDFGDYFALLKYVDFSKSFASVPNHYNFDQMVNHFYWDLNKMIANCALFEIGSEISNRLYDIRNSKVAHEPFVSMRLIAQHYLSLEEHARDMIDFRAFSVPTFMMKAKPIILAILLLYFASKLKSVFWCIFTNSSLECIEDLSQQIQQIAKDWENEQQKLMTFKEENMKDFQRKLQLQYTSPIHHTLKRLKDSLTEQQQPNAIPIFRRLLSCVAKYSMLAICSFFTVKVGTSITREQVVSKTDAISASVTYAAHLGIQLYSNTQREALSEFTKYLDMYFIAFPAP